MPQNKDGQPSKQPSKQGFKKEIRYIGEMFNGGGKIDNSELLNAMQNNNPPPKNSNDTSSNSKKD